MERQKMKKMASFLASQTFGFIITGGVFIWIVKTNLSQALAIAFALWLVGRNRKVRTHYGSINDFNSYGKTQDDPESKDRGRVRRSRSVTKN